MSVDEAVRILLGHVVPNEARWQEARALGALALIKLRQQRQSYVHALSVPSQDMGSYLSSCRDSLDPDNVITGDIPSVYLEDRGFGLTDASDNRNPYSEVRVHRDPLSHHSARRYSPT